tara:strand:- start:1161 stop:2000 length:840 start_codon:yes stop_codon:yes gene_type:complete
MNVVGLGSAGCGIADALSKYSQYKIFKIDVDISGDKCYNVIKLGTAEEYENHNFPKLDEFFKGIEGKTFFIVGGSGKISCASLKVLEKIKHLPISIIYIKPDHELLNKVQKMQDRIVFGVLQEYARSAVFEDICIISNEHLDTILGGAPIIGYHEKLNEIFATTFHMLNIFQNTKPVIGKIEKPKEAHRIMTIGMFDAEKNEEKMFFSLDNARESCYIYSISEDKLRTDKELFKKLKNQVKSKAQEDLNVTYAVYSSKYDYDLGYIIERTPNIQVQEVD